MKQLTHQLFIPFSLFLVLGPELICTYIRHIETDVSNGRALQN
jgi:hypothetical protein